MAYSKLAHMMEMLEALAAKMESDLPSAIAAAKATAARLPESLAHLRGDSERAGTLGWLAGASPDRVRELRAIIATFRPKTRRSNVRR